METSIIKLTLKYTESNDLQELYYSSPSIFWNENICSVQKQYSSLDSFTYAIVNRCAHWEYNIPEKFKNVFKNGLSVIVSVEFIKITL